MARYSKAIWRPVERYQPGGTVCRPMAAYNRYCLHTAVSNGSLFNFFNTPGNPVAHFYVFAGGTVEQYVDTRFQSTANLEGNPDTISVESEDIGFPFPDWGGSNVPAWTQAQVETLAELGAWIHDQHGIPIVACPNSLSGSKGFAYHRQGIDPWRVSGGEHWSKAYGKVCPGDRRMAQVDDIIKLAKDGNMPTADEIATAVWGYDVQDRVNGGTADASVMLSRIHKNGVDALSSLTVLLGRDPADVDEAALAAALAPLLSSVDTATLLAAIKGLPDAVRQTIKDAL